MMEKIKNLLTAKKPWLLFVLGLAGIGLIFLSSFFPEKESEPVTDTSDPTAGIEQRLEETISRIQGAGETHVMVTLADTGSRVYLSEEEEREEYADGDVSSREKTEHYITSGGGAVVVSEQLPAVIGVAVVCEGGDLAKVQSDVYEVIYALYGLSTSRVTIEKMQ